MRERELAGTSGPLACLALLLFASCRDLPLSESARAPEEPAGSQPGAASVPPGDLRSPVRIALTETGTLFVSDVRARMVVKFETDAGEIFATEAIAVPGEPLGVARVENLLLVGNATTHSVDVYQAENGRWLYDLGGQGAIADPTDIAVDSEGGLVFVLDGRGKTVKLFQLGDGAPLLPISGPGTGEFDLQNPTGIAVDVGRREVLVSDYGDPASSDAPPRVKIFTYGGAPVAAISGKTGMLGQRFSRPQGLAVDGAGHILLVDALAGEILVLDRATGVLLTTLGTFGSGPGELWLPLDVAIGRNGDVFVTNNRPRRVEVLSMGVPVP